MELFEQGLEYAAEGEWILALNQYNEAKNSGKFNQEQSTKLAKFRAIAYLNLKKHEEAVKDMDFAIKGGVKLTPKVMKQYAVALHSMKRFEDALEYFKQVNTLKPSEENAKWVDICEKLTPKKEEKKEEKPVITPQIRSDWYQSNTQVNVTVLVKNLTKDDVTVEFEETNLAVSLKLPGGIDHILDWSLFDKIIPSESTFRVSKYKVEVSLKKIVPAMWGSLERKEEEILPTAADIPSDVGSSGTTGGLPSAYSGAKKSWDTIDDVLDKELEEEVQGEAKLNKLFEQIYKNGSDDVRRAMIKSFQTSGGTVLSTDWTDVKEKDYEGKDMVVPEGMKYNKS
eukprot:TRINITY_DN170433_c0_g1_i1.p1 TRINITY_DN170433_c0_g1~~TRINITY_DN170433_c0_g1_i1.p1  ORF type:complete len:340 (-),score=119.83 TRINITY_DN170433_c0_g1_i1:141-1160(-)